MEIKLTGLMIADAEIDFLEGAAETGELSREEVVAELRDRLDQVQQMRARLTALTWRFGERKMGPA